jgi:hypothetical protein
MLPGEPVGIRAWNVGNTVFAAWLPPPSGEAVTSYVLTVSGTYAGAVEIPGRQVSGSAGPRSYTL